MYEDNRCPQALKSLSLMKIMMIKYPCHKLQLLLGKTKVYNSLVQSILSQRMPL